MTVGYFRSFRNKFFFLGCSTTRTKRSSESKADVETKVWCQISGRLRQRRRRLNILDRGKRRGKEGRRFHDQNSLSHVQRSIRSMRDECCKTRSWPRLVALYSSRIFWRVGYFRCWMSLHALIFTLCNYQWSLVQICKLVKSTKLSFNILLNIPYNVVSISTNKTV